MPRSRLKAQLVFCNVPTSNAAAARRFYSELLGSDDFVRAPNDEVTSLYRPLSEDGVDLNITQRFDDREGLTPYFAVANLDETLAGLQREGGTVVSDPKEVPIRPQKALEFYRAQMDRFGVSVDGSVGRMAVVLDVDGNHCGVIELEEHAHRHFRWGRFQRPLANDQLEELDQAKIVSNLFFAE
jgi:predicted enzyme related to lactoylglutathione lyase